jgi:hypothetical protein
MVQAANAFLASLTPQQRSKAVLSFDDQERFVWQEAPGATFTPCGVTLQATSATRSSGRGS